MREIRQVYVMQKKKEAKRWLRRVGLAYGMGALLIAIVNTVKNLKKPV